MQAGARKPSAYSPQSNPGGYMKMKLSLFMALLLVVVVFTLQNTETINIYFLFWQFSLSRALLLFLVLGIGILLGFILGSMRSERDKNNYDFTDLKDNNRSGA